MVNRLEAFELRFVWGDGDPQIRSNPVCAAVPVNI
jgi:hypothetical protein